MTEETNEERLERERMERFMRYLEMEKKAEASSHRAQKFEYLTEQYDLTYFTNQSGDGTRFFNMNGQAGWELMQMLSVPVTDRNAQLSSQCLLAIYRRPIVNDPI